MNKYYNLIASDEVEKLCEYEMNPDIAIVSGSMCAKIDEESMEKDEGWTFSFSVSNTVGPRLQARRC